jgi:hypothetical protein
MTYNGAMVRLLGWWLAGYFIVGVICGVTHDNRWASLLAAFILAGGIHMALYIDPLPVAKRPEV